MNTIDVSEEITALCAKLGVDPAFVYRIDVEPDNVTVYLYEGTEGRCKGQKFVMGSMADPNFWDRAPHEIGEAARETCTFLVTT